MALRRAVRAAESRARTDRPDLPRPRGLEADRMQDTSENFPTLLLGVERFEYTQLGERLTLVRLLATLIDRRSAPRDASLVVRRDEELTSHPARACRIEHDAASASGLLW